MKQRILVQLIALTIVCTTGPAHALTDETIFRNLQLDSARPGARALGLGGVSVAIVEDPSATAINPAGLAWIVDHQITAELRSANANDIGSQGAVGSSDMSAPVFPYVGFQGNTNPGPTASAGFIGFALPFELGDQRATLALSRSVALHRENVLDDANLAFALEDFPIWINPQGPNGAPAIEQYTVVNTSTGRLDAELIHYDLGLAMPLGRDFSLGATASLARLDVESSVLDRIQDPEGYLERPINPRADEDGDGVPDDVVSLSTINDRDSALAWGLGVTYEPRSRYDGQAPWRVAFAYRQGARLELSQTIAALDPVTGLPAPGEEMFETVVRVPDTWKVGGLGFPTRNWLVAAEVERVEYSDQLQGFDYGRDLLTSGFIDPEVLEQNDPGRQVQYDADDATIFRIGTEYTLRRGAWDVAARGGYYNLPDGRVHMTQFNSDSAEINQAFLGAMGTDRDVNHFTAGFSVTVPGGPTVDLGADLSDVADTFLLSATWTIQR